MRPSQPISRLSGRTIVNEVPWGGTMANNHLENSMNDQQTKQLFVKVVTADDGTTTVNFQGDYDYRFADKGVEYDTLNIAKESADGTGANLRGSIVFDGVYPQASTEKIETEFETDPMRTVVICVNSCIGHAHLRIAVPDGTTVSQSQTTQTKTVVRRRTGRRFEGPFSGSSILAMAIAASMFGFGNFYPEQTDASADDQ